MEYYGETRSEYKSNMRSDRPIVAIGELLWDLLPTGTRAGGAPFNFAFHCHQLGHRAIIVSRVGDDELGHKLRQEVRRLGLSDEFIQTDPIHPTGTVEVEIDNAGQPKYTVAMPVAWDRIEWTPGIDALAKDALAMCFGSLAQRSKRNRDLIAAFVAYTLEDCLTICDINFRRPFLTDEIIEDSLRICDWLKVNEEEAESIAKTIAAVFDSPHPVSHAEWLLTRLMAAILNDRAICAITRGANGCIVRNMDATVELPGIPITVADAVGAGDAFTAALLTQHLELKSLVQSAKFANAYAAVVASKPGGTPTVTREEVEQLL